MMRWYVLRSKPLKEVFLYQQLGFHDIEAYIPLVSRQKRTSSTRTTRNFFPGYLFVHVDLSRSGVSRLMWIPGSNGIICFGGEPGEVPESFILQMKRKMEHLNQTPQAMWSKFKKGDCIRIPSGPFEGYQAVFDQYLPSADRVRLMLKTIAEHQVRLELPGDQLAD